MDSGCLKLPYVIKENKSSEYSTGLFDHIWDTYWLKFKFKTIKNIL